MIDAWDEWLGSLALKGVDPREWDSLTMFAAYEADVRSRCQDEQQWQRWYGELTREPPEVRAARRTEAKTSSAPSRAAGRLSVDDAESMLARFAVADAAFGQ